MYRTIESINHQENVKRPCWHVSEAEWLAVDLNAKWSATRCFTKPSFLPSLLRSCHLGNQRHVQPLWQAVLCIDFPGGLQCQVPSLLYLFVTVIDTLPAMATKALANCHALNWNELPPTFPCRCSQAALRQPGYFSASAAVFSALS